MTNYDDDDAFGVGTDGNMENDGGYEMPQREVQQEGEINVRCGIAPGRVYAFDGGSGENHFPKIPARSTIEYAVRRFVSIANSQTPESPVNVDSMEVRLNGEVIDPAIQDTYMLTEGDKVHLTMNKKGA